MASPRIVEQSAKGGMIAIFDNWLAQLEKRLYKRIPPPDVVLNLRVSIETAKKRNR